MKWQKGPEIQHGTAHKGIFIKKAAFPVSSQPMFKTRGGRAVSYSRTCDAVFLKEIPTALQSTIDFFKKLKRYHLSCSNGFTAF